MKKLIIFLLAIVALYVAARTVVYFFPPLSDVTPNEYVELLVGQDDFVRMDEQNKRFFIIRSRLDIEATWILVKKNQQFLDRYFQDWSHRWALSIFSNRKFAGYKDNPALLPFVQSGEWARGYLAEYDAATGILTLDPATKPVVISTPSAK